jgi:hypothetical protein
MCLDSRVGITTRYGLDGTGIESRGGARFPTPIQTGPVAHPTSYAMDTVSFLGVKGPGCGVDHPPHLALRLKKEYHPLLGFRGLF